MNGFRKVDIQIENEGVWRTLIGGDMPDYKISSAVAYQKRIYAPRRIRAIDRATGALLDLQ